MAARKLTAASPENLFDPSVQRLLAMGEKANRGHAANRKYPAVCSRPGKDSQRRRPPKALPDAPESDRPFRYRFDSTQARQIVRQGHFWGLEFALKKRARRARRWMLAACVFSPRAGALSGFLKPARDLSARRFCAAIHALKSTSPFHDCFGGAQGPSNRVMETFLRR